MTRRLPVILLAIVSSVAAVNGAAAQTVDELLAKNVQAKGGMEKLRSIQTVKQTGRLNIQGMEGKQVVYAKRPNLLRQELTIAGSLVVMAFDGQTPWMINPNLGAVAPIAMNGPLAEMIRDQSSFDGPLIALPIRVPWSTREYAIDSSRHPWWSASRRAFHSSAAKGRWSQM